MMRVRSSLTALLLLLLVSSGVVAQLPAIPNTITVSLVPDPIGGRNLLLRVEATEVTDLYGLSFAVEFPKKRLRWIKNSKVAGSFLSANDTEVTIVIDRQKPRGTVFVGASRLGEIPGVSGSGVLLDIGFFNRSKPGPRELTLTDTMAFDSNALPIADIVWQTITLQDPGE